MNKRSRDDIIFDTILEQAFNDAAEVRFNEIEKECPKNTQLSEKHKKIERKAYQKYTQRNRSVSLSSRLKPFHKVAACFVAVLLAGAIMVFSVPTVRAGFNNFIISVFDKYISLDPYNTNNNSSIETIDYTFDYIPEGYEEVAYNDLGIISYTFQSTFDDTYFEISYYPSAHTSISFDNEYSKITECTINGYIGYWVKYDISPVITLVWNDGNNIFKISGTVSEEIISEIARNIFKKS